MTSYNQSCINGHSRSKWQLPNQESGIFQFIVVPFMIFFSFREGMYLVSVATFPEGLLLSGVVKHLRKFID